MKLINLLVLTATLLVLTSCASKKVKPSADEVQVTDESESFDPGGSDTGQIMGLSSINFAYDASHLTEEAKAMLQGNADWLRQNEAFSLQIEGHCDSRGSVEYNLSLGERRAASVRSYLISLGIAADRLSTVSYGKEKPLALGESEFDHARNRRANFVPMSN